MHIHFLLVRRLQNQTKELSLDTNFKLGTRIQLRMINMTLNTCKLSSLHTCYLMSCFGLMRHV